MLLFIQYPVKLSISLAIVWLFYQFVLRKLTFYNSNRWYLLGYTLFCFFIPFIDISPVLQQNKWANSTPVSWVPVIENYRVDEMNVTSSYNFFTTWNIVMLVMATGMLIMFFRLLFQLVSFRRMMRKAKAIPGENINLFQVDEEIIPFSFGNSIFLNQHLHTAEELQEIMRHEFVHVKQKHSIDIIWGELLCLFNWYNPFAWLLKRSIRQNLEFIADNKVLENGIDKKQYQYLLLKVIGNNQFSIAPKFNFSSLKKRIAMMNKLKTAKLHLVRFLFILPLLAVILLSFRKQIGNSLSQDKNKDSEIIISGDFTDTVPDVMELNDKGYYIDVKGKDGNCIVVVKDKNLKEVARVLLTKWKENQEYYDNLYGEILPPPPTPPLPPTRPDPPQLMEIPENVKRIDVNDKKATVTLKDGKVEIYNWNKEEEKAAFGKKYGDILPTPPTPLVPATLPDYIKRIDRNAEFVEIWLKDGPKESYNLKIPSEKAAFEKKYGEVLRAVESPYPTTEVHELSATQELNRANIGDGLEIDDNKATVHLKNGKVEEYNLTNEAEKKKFETRYGKIIEVSTRVEGVNEPVTVIGHPINKSVHSESVTVIEHPINKNVSNEAVTVVGHSLNKNVNDEPITGISAEGTRSVIAPTKIAEEGVVFLNDDGSPISGEEEILVTITNKSTQQQLEGFIKQLKEKGIQLQFDNTKYDNGILLHIDGSMKIKGSTNSFSATDFNKLILSRVKDGDHIYLKVNVVEKKTS